MMISKGQITLRLLKNYKNHHVSRTLYAPILSAGSLCSYLVQVLFVLALWQNVACSADDSFFSQTSDDESWIEFAHEKCMKEVLSTNQYQNFHPVKDNYGSDGVLELLVRFKGIADGHIILTRNATANEPRYTISLGSYNNRFSEIRRIQPHKVETKISTPSIMSDLQFRGFKIRYDGHNGQISVFGEGSDVPLISLEDTNETPLNVRYFSFATWHNRIVQVAFGCVPKDAYSMVNLESSGAGMENQSFILFLLRLYL